METKFNEEIDELPKAFHWVGHFPNKIALTDGSFFFSFAVQKSSKRQPMPFETINERASVAGLVEARLQSRSWK